MNRPSSVSTLTAGPGERVLEVLDFHVCAGELCATVVLEPIDSCPALECCIPAEQLHVDTVSRNIVGADKVAGHGLFRGAGKRGAA